DGALRLDPVPLPQLSSYGFTLRYQGHWGVRIRLERGLVEIAVPASGPGPVEVRLPDGTARLRPGETGRLPLRDRKSTRLNSSHVKISYAVFCLKKKNHETGPVAGRHRPP